MGLFPYFKSRRSFHSPVLVVDALGFAQKIIECDALKLQQLADRLGEDYLRFRMAVPHRLAITLGRRLWGTPEFTTFRLNDMFVVFSRMPKDDFVLRYLVTGSIVFQSLLAAGFIPRGGLGWGLLHARSDALIGAGFVDAYATAEKRSGEVRDICAVQLSKAFLAHVPRSAHVQRLLCFYRGAFFINPIALVDPDRGKFDRQRILNCLEAAGANRQKLVATESFLHDFEDYEAAAAPQSKSRRWVRDQMSRPPKTDTTPPDSGRS